eukprot:TCALIF_03374-PA protein Name:"Similar to CAND1 Cullin-associated NEDD8-dissociated protein 1 (Pongo abelii)" AED:0.06 eAED:0.07 QI:1083/0.72/0.58/1/0.90/0.83/12/134/999
MEMCLKYMCHDPNYNYDDADEDESMECDDEEEDESDEEYSDDDDMSWKVRRSAAKCLEAIIATRHEMLNEFYRQVSPALISRFKEREENVKADIFHAFVALLRQTKPVISVSRDPNSMEIAEDGPGFQLQRQVPDIVKALHKQMKEKSVKTRQGCFNLLTQLILVLPGALSEHISAVIPGIQYSLSEKQSTSNMKIDTLAFIQHLLVNNQPASVFHPHAPVLVPTIISAVSDPFYKISSEALVVLESLVMVIRPLEDKANESPQSFKPYVTQIYECCFVRLKASDIDQEVKERAISCMGRILAHLGDHLQTELASCLPILLDRLKNEITRLTTVKALTRVANSNLKIDLVSILPEAMPILASFLRKNQRTLKLSTLVLLDTLVSDDLDDEIDHQSQHPPHNNTNSNSFLVSKVRNYNQPAQLQNLTPVVSELSNLISEADLHIAQLTLVLLTSIARTDTPMLGVVANTSLPEALRLTYSPLLQGAALVALKSFFQALVLAKSVPDLNSKRLLDLLVGPVLEANGANIHKQGRASMAKCVAAVVETQSPAEAMVVVQQFSSQLTAANSLPHQKTFALLALAEIGRNIDLSKTGNMKEIVLESFNNMSEEVKSAASYALGNISLGNLKEYLPFVLHEIETQSKRQYLLLHSLKEVRTSPRSNILCPLTLIEKVLGPYIPAIWEQLFKHCQCQEEGTRNVVAECLGKLCLIDPEKLLPELQTALNSPSPLMRTTVVTAMKFTISDQPQSIDALLKDTIGEFLKTLEDPDLSVRRVALVAFNSAAHNKPSLIRDLLPTTLPHLYNETQKRKELIREVEMGPFKHEVDDGLDLRKAAFECMYTLLDTCVDRLDIFEFLSHVQDGLKDHYDIKMLTYLMVMRAAQLCPVAVLTRLDKLVEPLKATVTTKVKANAVKQEYEKQDELKRSALRAVATLAHVPGADKHPQMNDFLNQIRNTPDLASLFESVQKDSHAGLGGALGANGAGASGFGHSRHGTDPHAMDFS